MLAEAPRGVPLANFSSTAPSPVSPDPFAPPRADLEPRVVAEADKLRPADRGARFGAYMVDWLILVPTAGLGAAVGWALNRSFHIEGEAASGVLIIFAALFALPVQIYQWYATAARGQSLGKRFCKIRIVRVDGSPAGFVHGVLLRSWVPAAALMLLALINLDPVARILNFIDTVSIFSTNRRMIHDLIAGTCVVSTETETPLTPTG
jgi:uncharacterized RDD family membrane protein YckC